MSIYVRTRLAVTLFALTEPESKILVPAALPVRPLPVMVTFMPTTVLPTPEGMKTLSVALATLLPT